MDQLPSFPSLRLPASTAEADACCGEQDYKLKLTTLERRRLDYDADRRSIAKLEMKRSKAAEKNVALKPEVTTQLQAKEHTALGTLPPPVLPVPWALLPCTRSYLLPCLLVRWALNSASSCTHLCCCCCRACP